MKKRPRFKHIQCRALDLFNKGFNVFRVAEELAITISEARRIHLLFIQSEQITPDRRREVTEFLEAGYRRDCEKLATELISDLPEIRRIISPTKEEASELSFRIGVISGIYPDVIAAFFFFPGTAKFAYWDADGSDFFINKVKEIRIN